MILGNFTIVMIVEFGITNFTKYLHEHRLGKQSCEKL